MGAVRVECAALALFMNYLRDFELSKLGLEKTYAPKDAEVRLQKTYKKDVYTVRVSS